MSKGKDFRPRRRGFDDDEPMPYDDRPSRFQPRPNYDEGFPPVDMGGSAPSPAAIDATVKWFKGDKGFGFVELSDGSGDAFLHINVLQVAGYEMVPPGTKLKVIAGKGMKGMQVSNVLEVDTSTATAPAPRQRDFDGPRSGGGGGGGRPALDPSSAVEIDGQVKWFDGAKGFGFIAASDGGKDIFIHVSVLRDAGLATLDENQAVKVKVVETPKGREAVGVRA
ncbi:MAG: cold shock domain-containing protein [Beijerinckiaceae bacterium]|nr:cold shock domain-containing protein [Beijerinckiaceae bacterium]